MDFKTDVKKQHTVPRFLLDNFGFGKKNKKRKLHVFDKEQNNTFIQSVYDATTKNSFYNLYGDSEKSLEGILSKIESDVSPIIKKIIKLGTISFLSMDDKYKISVFILSQHARTLNTFDKIKKTNLEFLNRLSEIGFPNLDIESLKNDDSSKMSQEIFLDCILDCYKLVDHILNKSWALYENKKDNFLISDNPLTLHNTLKQNDLRGNLGYAVEGIEIYMPISTKYTLSFTCSSIYIKLKNHLMYGKRSLNDFELKNILKLLDAFDNGCPLICDDENILFLNSLQVMYSKRFLYSCNQDFSLVTDMINLKSCNKK